MIKNTVNENVKELVDSCEKDGIEVSEELVTVWITDILESLSKEDILTVTTFLLTHEKNKENLLRVYSFVNECFENRVNNQ